MTHPMPVSRSPSLRLNKLGEVGGTAVAEAIKVNTSLQNLKYVPWYPISNCLGGY